ncbi:cobalamin biosynthesis protein CobW [Novosphingobium sp. CF614]|uniref:cobalamin biosynthesis protein CobW n=1 Tax=Novosphingobium sp. CF614 TaxID=1884364 RepID=UPI0008E23E28|nr:cobalamin biosynthesis protein CobW [Novosphingobium sp. CF614]SFG01420.1 cobalamin biosynthesis protein CobW [Novosphingobium sp. CF614]
MSELSKVPVTIVTGFLGAGKTTLISHLIRNAGGRRLAVVVNEFGTLGVDGDILQSCAVSANSSIHGCPAENIVELANGCICCTVADDFIPTVEKLLALDPRPDHILIETSGLALPKPLLKAFDWPAIRSRITVDGVLALADAEAVAAGRFAPDVAALDAQRAADPSVDHEAPLSEVFEDQLACADMVLLTKVDLAGPEGAAAARALILAKAPRPVPVIELAEGVIDPRVILGLGAAAEDDVAARPSHHDGEDDHEHGDFDSTVIALGAIAEPADLVARIETLARDHDILRVKGYAAVADKPMRLLVQAVGARVRYQYDRPWRPGEARCTTLVVIAEHDRVDAETIRGVLAN